jgi:immune inhibitor A
VRSRNAEQALAARVTQPLPPRNLYTLTDQLRLRPPRAIRRVIRTSSPNYPVGHSDRFEVLNEDTNRYFTIDATIQAKTAHLYLYVQNGLSIPDADVRQAARTFENSVYPTDRSYFGSEWRPGVDGDPHLTCLVGDLRSGSIAGFYSAEDEYPHLVNRWSNQREMFYVDAGQARPGQSYFMDIMSHEFQHMIHWHMHPRDNAWTNEGMSVLAEHLNHFTSPNTGYAAPFMDSPTTQLNSWSLDASSIAHYGAAYLFLKYVHDHYGRALIKTIVADQKYTDFELINDALRKQHIHTTARAIFAHWVAANWIGNSSAAGPLYSYDVFGYQPTFVAKSVPFTVHNRIPPWAAKYTVIQSPSAPFTLSFSAPTTVPLVSFPDAGNGWWSNRGDMSDTSLQRTVDLRGVHSADLRFRAAYDIEKEYDYAYVEASTDSGKTWTTLRGTDTTTANCCGASFGNGYTGSSKGWRNETVSLSRYAGKRILLRFQYITDDEYNGQGLLIKNISIPQIHYRDTGTGWTEHGFVPTGPGVLPTQWTVELISYTAHGVAVSDLPLSGGSGHLTVNPAKTGLKKLVIIAFTTAPKTSVPSTYTLRAK